MNNLAEKTVIAVDAMGGDNAPEEIVKGVATASLESPGRFILVGHEERISKILSTVPHNSPRIEIHHTDEYIAMEEMPREAVRRKPKASIVIASKLCAEGRAHGVVSAGNTGAYVLAATLYIPRIAGVRKTAIAAVYPTRNLQKRKDHFALLLDVGANIHSSIEDMVQFALMGKIYASDIKGIEDPTVALLNIGKESYKGGELLTSVYKILEELPEVNFIGNIEGNEVMLGLSDVVVTEGYVGNIVTKTIEGMAEMASHFGRYAFKRRLLWRLGMIALSGGIKKLKSSTDYSEYGGAPLLGFKEIVIKAHGRSKAKAITNAVKLAAKSHRDDVCGRIERAIAGFESKNYMDKYRDSAP